MDEGLERSGARGRFWGDLLCTGYNMEHYIPTEEDIRGARGIVAHIREGGVLAFPSTLLVYTVHHGTKTLHLTNPEQLADADAQDVHDRTIVVFAHLGWKVD